MSTVMLTSERSTSTSAKPRRVLACVLCQQRKVKCDRKFPCANCTKSHAQCVPATLLGPSQRRRRFPERELLDRLRRYESLLRQNNISFEPLHKDPPTIEQESLSPAEGRHDHRHDEQSGAATAANTSSSPSMTIKSETASKARYALILEVTSSFTGLTVFFRNIWQAMNQRGDYMRSSCEALLTEAEQSRDSDDDGSDSSSDGVRETMVNLKKHWDHWHQSNVLLFGSRNTAIDLPTLHPEQIQIFRLWQVYLDNVNPLLKVTHTPTLQGNIINAASNVTSIKPTLAALMFSIYSVSVLSLVDSECLAMFGSPKEQLLRRYQFGCQQALLDCEFLRSTDRDCLTALYLYLVSLTKRYVHACLTRSDLGQTKYGPRLLVHHAWPRDPHGATHGTSSRVGICQMPRS